MEGPSFEEVQKHLTEKFLQDAPTAETDEELGSAILDLVLQSERLRRCVKAPSTEQDEVDRQTLERLSDQTELGPENALVESVFRRLTKDPPAAMRHYRQAVQQRSAAQAQRAKSPRPRRWDSITRLINDIVADDTSITAEKVFEELTAIDGIIVIDGEIRNTQDSTTMKVGNLASRVSDAKKRTSG